MRTSKTHYLLGSFTILFFLATILTGLLGARFVDLRNTQIRDDIQLVGALDNTNSVGQTFIAQKPYLSSVKLFFDALQNDWSLGGKYHLFIHLQDSSHKEIASQVISIPAVVKNWGVDFTFPPQPNSLNKSYFLLIETDAPSNLLSIWCSEHDDYPDGTAYLNGTPAAFDLTFETYDRPTVVYWIAGIFHNNSRTTDLLGISLLFLLLGFITISILGWPTQVLIERVIYSLGIGIVMPPVILLVLSLVGIKINQTNIFIALAILVVLAGARYLIADRDRNNAHFLIKMDWKEGGVLGLMFLLAVFSRGVQINDLTVPNWVDGIVHQQFVARILERQTVSFDSIYPKGFHSNVVFLYLLFGGSLPDITLMMGQWLSLISGLTFYLLARRLLKPSYGLFALGLYWFWAAFPAFLINWGRFPYLQGLVLLPLIVNFYYIDMFKLQTQLGLLILMLVGLGLTYYGAFFLLLAFILEDVLSMVTEGNYSRAIQKSRVVALSLLPIVVILVVRFNVAMHGGVLGQESAATWFDDANSALGISLNHGGWTVWLFGLAGFVLAFVVASQRFLRVISWGFILIFFYFLQTVFNITISSVANLIVFLSIPSALLAGFFVRFLWIKFGTSQKLVGYLLVLFLSFFGAYNISSIIQPTTVLFLPADQPAMEWIKNNTSPGSVFLINSFLWGNTLSPSDGGGWISFLANRKSILYNANESKSMVNDEGSDYIYLGRTQGDINPDDIVDNPHFSLVYNMDGVRIYKRILSKGN